VYFGIILIACILFGTVSCARDVFTPSESPAPASDFTYTVHSDTVAITGYSGPGGNVVIPEVIEGKTVTSIGKLSSFNCTNLTSVMIPSGVAYISDSAFYDCSYLSSIMVSKSNNNYQDIDGVLFSRDGTRLLCYPPGKQSTGYTIPDGVYAINDRAFWMCRNLTHVTIPDGVINIGHNAFAYCPNLTSIVVPSSVTSIGFRAFVRNCEEVGFGFLCEYSVFITCPRGSYAQQYCQENGIEHQLS